LLTREFIASPTFIKRGHVMNKKQIKGRVIAVKAQIKEAAGRLIGNKAMERKGLAEKSVAHKKVLVEDLKEDFRKLA
jgi:uncharacterized protein YjbJ (UPF0337 family)